MASNSPSPVFPDFNDDGMDGVEMLDAVERAFRIKIKDREAEACLLVGDLHALVLQKCRHAERGTACLSANAFRLLRRVVAEIKPNVTVIPTTPAHGLLSSADLRSLWTRMNQRCGLDMPESIESIVPWLILVASLGGVYGLYRWMGAAEGGVALIAGLLANTIIFYGRDHFFPPRLPAQYKTVGDLARALAQINPAFFAGPVGMLRTRDIFPMIQRIIQSHAGLKSPPTSDMPFYR